MMMMRVMMMVMMMMKMMMTMMMMMMMMMMLSRMLMMMRILIQHRCLPTPPGSRARRSPATDPRRDQTPADRWTRRHSVPSASALRDGMAVSANAERAQQQQQKSECRCVQKQNIE
jgi:hypothetical protein